MKILAQRSSDFPIHYLIISTTIVVRSRNTISAETHSKPGLPVITVTPLPEYLIRETDLKILRVCSARCEEAEFPIPNKVQPVRESRSAEEMAILSPKVRNVCLHHVIRAPDSPYARRLKQIEETFGEDKRNGERSSDTLVKEYCKVRLVLWK